MERYVRAAYLVWSPVETIWADRGEAESSMSLKSTASGTRDERAWITGGERSSRRRAGEEEQLVQDWRTYVACPAS